MESPSRLRRLVGVGSRFLVVGAISTLIEVGVFNLLVYVFGWDLVAAKITASVVALANAYIGNREWTFRHRDRRGRVAELLLFLAANAVCTALGAVLVWAGVELVTAVAGRSPGVVAVNIVNLVSIVIVVLLRFVLYHSVVFRVSSTRADDSAG